MAWLDRLRNVLRPSRLHGDVERELAFHVRERVDELRADGMSEDEAQRTARRQFGNSTVQVERTRDVDVNQRFEALLRNLRLAARALWKTPAFTATVVVTLALGIGANSAVFSAIYAVLLRPLPFPRADQLMTLGQQHPKIKLPLVSPVRLEDCNRLTAAFQTVTGYYIQDDSETSGELPERVRHALVAPRFLQVMGVAPALGRDFAPLEEHAGGPQAVLISDRFWRRRFGADPNVTAKILRMGGWALPVIGVMPPSFIFPDRDVDLWTVSAPDFSFAKDRRDLTWFTAVGRAKAGVSLEQAQANLTTVQADLGREYPKTDKDITVLVKPLKEVTVGAAKNSLWLLFGSVTVLLVIACTNVAALLLARKVSRQHEIAVRFSLGASRATVIGQLLAEAWVLALSGAALGLGVAAGASGVFRPR